MATVKKQGFMLSLPSTFFPHGKPVVKMQITNKQVSILGPMSIIDQHPEMKPVHLQGFKKY